MGDYDTNPPEPQDVAVAWGLLVVVLLCMALAW